jgi:8-oxo-dGTP pyrophosphatase MutT (NUDIX family)
VSVGGHVDAGEDYPDAAKREAFEEVGVRGVPFAVQGKYIADEMEDGNRVRQFVTVYRAEWHKQLTPDPVEVAGVKWVSIPELGAWLNQSPQEFSPAVRAVYDNYLQPTAPAKT